MCFLTIFFLFFFFVRSKWQVCIKVSQELLNACFESKTAFFAVSYSHVNCRVLLMTGPQWAKSRSDFLSIVNHFLCNISVIWSLCPGFLATFPILLSGANQLLENVNFTWVASSFSPQVQKCNSPHRVVIISLNIRSENLLLRVKISKAF